MLRIATHNVNGIRSAVRRGYAGWLATSACDVVAIQEMRAPVSEVPMDALGDFHLTYHPGVLRGRNGVAFLTRVPPTAVRQGFGHRSDEEGRYLEIDLDAPGHPPLTLGCLYLPKGASHDGPEADPAKYRRKTHFMASFRSYLRRARLDAGRRGREFVVMGDFNIAHDRHDVKNWRSAQTMEGFLPNERDWMDSLLGPRTLIDVLRAQHPDEDGPYSWWSWMPGAFDRNTGWRIDYQLATPALARTASQAVVHREADSASRLSDHAPVVIDYEV